MSVSDDAVYRYAFSQKTNPASLLARETVREVPCPECGAESGHSCQGVRGPRVANHLGRCVDRIRLLIERTQ